VGGNASGVYGQLQSLHNTVFTNLTTFIIYPSKEVSYVSQFTVSLNGTTITQAIELYNCRSLLETLLNFGNDAATTHLTNAMWILVDGNLAACDPTATDSTNKGFMTRWNATNRSQEIELYGRIHTDFCNVPVCLLPHVRLQIKFTKAKSIFYLMNKDAQSKPSSSFLMLNYGSNVLD